jgi:endoglucanase
MVPPTAADADAFAQVQLIKRGINISNYLDQPGQPADPTQPQCPASPPVEGQATGGGKLHGWMFEAIKNAGFDHVRLTVNWNCHTVPADENDHEIDMEWLARVDWAIAHALTRGLSVIIDMHNFWDYFNGQPHARGVFVNLWRQLAWHYRNYPKQLFFELLNEPPFGFDDATLNEDLLDALDAIRIDSRYRSVIFGGTNYNKTAELARVTQLPADDKNLIATIHYYTPYCFTHGQTWDCPTGHVNASNVEWPVLFPADFAGDPAAAAAAQQASEQKVEDDLNAVVTMSEQIGRPIYIGEFGAIESRSVASRAAYIAAVARAAEARNLGWAHWAFFNTQYDAWNGTGDWYPEIIRSLLPN